MLIRFAFNQSTTIQLSITIRSDHLFDQLKIDTVALFRAQFDHFQRRTVQLGMHWLKDNLTPLDNSKLKRR